MTGRGSEVGERFIASPQIDFIAFTGLMEVSLHAWLWAFSFEHSSFAA